MLVLRVKFLALPVQLLLLAEHLSFLPSVPVLAVSQHRHQPYGWPYSTVHHSLIFLWDFELHVLQLLRKTVSCFDISNLLARVTTHYMLATVATCCTREVTVGALVRFVAHMCVDKPHV